MNTGFERLVHPATPVSAVDLDATRSDRERIHEDIRMREYIAWLIDNSAPGSEVVRISPFRPVRFVPSDDETDPDEGNDQVAG